MKKNKKKPKLYKDKNGEYIKQWYFVRGKQKFIKIYIIDGIPADEFYLQNADPITLLQDGHYELLDQINFWSIFIKDKLAKDINDIGNEYSWSPFG